MTGLFSLPDDLLLSLLGEWLSTRDLSRLDASTVSAPVRREYLRLLRSPHCSTEDDVSPLTQSFFSWIVTRQLRLRSLSLSPSLSADSAFVAVLQLRHYLVAQGGMERLAITGSLSALGEALRECVFAVAAAGLRTRRLRSLSLGGDVSDADAWQWLTLFSQAQRDSQREEEKKKDLSPFGINSHVNDDDYKKRSSPYESHRGAHNEEKRREEGLLPPLSLLSLTIGHTERLSSASLLRLVSPLSALCELSLYGVKCLDDDSLFSLLTLSAPHLRTLSLTHCERVSDAVWLRLQQERRGASLALASLSLTESASLSDLGAVAIVRLRHSAWRHLSLAGCVAVSDITVKEIAENASFVKTLDLSRCPLVTRGSVLLLRSRCDLEEIYCHDVEL